MTEHQEGLLNIFFHNQRCLKKLHLLLWLQRTKQKSCCFSNKAVKMHHLKAIVVKTKLWLPYCAVFLGTPDLTEFPLSYYCLLNQFPVTDASSFRVQASARKISSYKEQKVVKRADSPTTQEPVLDLSCEASCGNHRCTTLQHYKQSS